VLAGSGSMIMHGMERKPRDIDIFCATATWFGLLRSQRGNWNVFCTDPDDAKRRCDPPYLYKDMHGIEVNIFCDWRKRGIGEINVAFWIHNAVVIEGIPCVPLQLLLDWKEEVGRSKDTQDIAAIKQFTGGPRA
jgi:hypothetical protein